MDRERSRSPLGRGRATSPSPSTPDSAGGGATAQLSRHTDSSLDDMEFLRSSCRLVQDSGTQPLESSTDDLDYYRTFCTSSLEQQQPKQERWALHAVIRKCIVLSDMYFHFFFPQHISLSLFWLSTSSLLPNLFTEIIIILECGFVLFSHTHNAMQLHVNHLDRRVWVLLLVRHPRQLLRGRDPCPLEAEVGATSRPPLRAGWLLARGESSSSNSSSAGTTAGHSSVWRGRGAATKFITVQLEMRLAKILFNYV